MFLFVLCFFVIFCYSFLVLLFFDITCLLLQLKNYFPVLILLDYDSEKKVFLSVRCFLALIFLHFSQHCLQFLPILFFLVFLLDSQNQSFFHSTYIPSNFKSSSTRIGFLIQLIIPRFNMFSSSIFSILDAVNMKIFSSLSLPSFSKESIMS